MRPPAFRGFMDFALPSDRSKLQGLPLLLAIHQDKGAFFGEVPVLRVEPVTPRCVTFVQNVALSIARCQESFDENVETASAELVYSARAPKTSVR